MRFFSIKVNDKKFKITIFVSFTFVFGIIFGCFHYFHGSDELINSLSQLFFITKEGHTNSIGYYLLVTGIYIGGSIICSTSYLGMILNSFIVFFRGLHISYALLFLFINVGVNAETFILCLVPQIVIETIFTIFLTVICLKLSINTFMISFVVKDIFKGSRIIHYVLDYLIVILTIFSISMIFRIYFI